MVRKRLKLTSVTNWFSRLKKIFVLTFYFLSRSIKAIRLMFFVVGNSL